MVDLKVVCGIPLTLDEETGTLFYGESVDFEKEVSVSINEMLPYLLNKSIRYPEQVFRQYKGVQFKSDKEVISSQLSYDVLHIPYGLLGIEFVKTHIYYSDYQKDKYDSIIEVISGEITLLIQHPQDEVDDLFEDEDMEIDIIELKEGERMAIPTGVYYTFVNTSSSSVILARVSSKKNSNIVDFRSFKDKRGLALFIISKNARIEIVSNPRYRGQCKANRSCWNELDKSKKVQYIHSLVDGSTPLYNMYATKSKELEKALV